MLRLGWYNEGGGTRQALHIPPGILGSLWTAPVLHDAIQVVEPHFVSLSIFELHHSMLGVDEVL